MTRKPASGAARGLYCGLTLAEWRGTIRTLLSSGWWVFGEHEMHRDGASSLHFAVVQATCLLLPLSWHKTHPGRFHEMHYRQRRGRVNARAYALSQRRERERHAT